LWETNGLLGAILTQKLPNHPKEIQHLCTMQVHNFSAGPCILPQEVMQQAAEAVKSFGPGGLSLIEMSHRSKEFVAVMEEARALAKSLRDLPDRYEVLFLQGGASLGFLTAAYNLLPENGSAHYVDTGTWANNAIKEARHLGEIDVLASSKETNYDHIPSFDAPRGGSYLHITSNNTIFGTQYAQLPKAPVPLVADMSSDIFSRSFDAEDYALIYAGAQKNMGPAGTVFYAVDPDRIGKTGRNIPSYLDLNVHIKKESMFNTPPVFSVYVTLLMLRWMRDQGGLEAMQSRAAARAAAMYNEIDRNPLFVGHAEIGSRSQMNATFRLAEGVDGAAFDALWAEAGISGIKGHRSVGGYRASMYNALPLESVQVLVSTMQHFEQHHG